MNDSAIKYTTNETDPDIRKKSRWAALLAILFWVLVMGIPLFSYTFPLPEKTGILLAFGDEDGGGEEQASAQSDDVEIKKADLGAEKADEENEKSQEKAAPKVPEKNIKAETEEETNINTSKSVEKTTPKVVKESKAENKRDIEAERKAKQLADQQKKLAEFAARKKKQEEAKKSFADAFGGSGDGSSPTQQGNEDGSDDGSKLEGLISGKGNIGTGLADRGVVFEPEINENSQKVGRIVVRICVNSQGKVTEAAYTQKGSTSTDLALIEVAEKAALEYVFSSSNLDKQCGNISIDFKLK